MQRCELGYMIPILWIEMLKILCLGSEMLQIMRFSGKLWKNRKSAGVKDLLDAISDETLKTFDQSNVLTKR